MNQEEVVISEFLTTIGPWREFVVIGGGFALFIYKLYLADPKLQNLPVGTRDIDSLIPRKVPEVSTKSIAKHLSEAGFRPIFKDLHIPATQSYTKEIDGMEVEVEFLTDSSTRTDKDKNIVVAGVVAQPLGYLNLSLQNTLEFQTYSQMRGSCCIPRSLAFSQMAYIPTTKKC